MANKRFCIISYYTPEYRLEVLNLLRSTSLLNIPHSNLLIPSFGSWVENCAFKPRFIYAMIGMLQQYEAVVYVDADAVIVKYPELFNEYLNKKVCFAAHTKRHELLSGTIFIRKCSLSRLLLEDWILQQIPEKWDQKVLQPIFEKCQEVEGEKYVANLPMEYCKIFDAPDMKCDEPVIIHNQASRRLKKIVNGASNEIRPR